MFALAKRWNLGAGSAVPWIALLFACFLGTGCAPKEKAARPPRLTYALGTEITSLDPVRVTEDNPRLVSAQVMETLVTYDENLNIKPLLAESWESLEGGRVWRFKLRRDVFYHDDPCFAGKKWRLTAADVVYSLRRLLDPKAQTLGAFILSDIVTGGSDLANGKEGVRIGIVAEDPYTVVFHLTKPYALLPARLSLPFAAIVPEIAVRYYGNQWGTHPIGTGPFRFGHWDKGSGLIELERNRSYWRRIASNVQWLDFRILKSDVSQLASFRQGQIDAFEIRPAIAAQVFSGPENKTTSLPHTRIIQRPILKVQFVGLNFRNDFVKNANFRKALNYAIDKRALVERVLNGLAVPATGPIPPGLPGYDPSPLYTKDVAKAKSLLMKSGFKGQQLLYTTDNSTESEAVAELLQGELGAIGVPLRIDKNPESVWVDKLVHGSFDLGKLYFALDYPSPDNPLSQFLSSNFSPQGPNFLHYSNPTFDKLYEQSLRTANGGANQFKEMSSIIREDAPWIFLYYPVRTLALRDSVQNLKINALSFSLLLDDVKVK